MSAPRVWTLPDGTRVRGDASRIEIAFPRSETWVLLAPDAGGVADLLAALTRLASDGGRHG